MTELNLGFFRTKEGILKIVQFVANLIGGIIMLADVVHFTSEGKFYEFTTITGVIAGIIEVLAKLANFKLDINALVMMIHLGFSVVWALFNLIASSIIIKYARWSHACGACVFFGYVACITYVIEAFFLFMKFKRGSSGSAEPDGGQPWSTQAPPPKY